MKKIIFAAVTFLFAVYLSMGVSAEKIEASGISQALSDNNVRTRQNTEKFEVSSDKGIDCMYIVFYSQPQKLTLNNGKETKTYDCKFLQQFIDVSSLFGSPANKITVTLPQTEISDISVFDSKENLPEYVHIWNDSVDRADLLLFTSHSDDEQLFFSGFLPLYAGQKGLRVQVCYMTDHGKGPFTNLLRRHELLNGLWTVGVKSYPVVSEFPDYYGTSIDTILSQLKSAGYSEDDVLNYQIECIRRFKPQVILTHDTAGEYGHGMHMLTSKLIKRAIEGANDKNIHVKSFSQYGTWDTPKVYLHLYGENQIVLNYDEPLEKFGGKTAFQVSQDGFMCHSSQLDTWFYGWIFGKGTKITKASQIDTYSPCKWGLLRSLVGEDVEKNDFFENLISYEIQEKIQQAEEELAKIEAEINDLKSQKESNEKKISELDNELSKMKSSLVSSRILLVVFYLIDGAIIVIGILYVLRLRNKKHRRKMTNHK